MAVPLPGMLSCACFLAVLGQEGVGQGAKLLQVQLVTRHGAREELSKEAATLVEGGAALTAEGETQLAALGSQLRAHYLLPPDALLPELVAYSAEEVWVESSAPDRAIASASALVGGLWPPSDPYAVTQVPVHTLPSRHDTTIRAYHSCPAYHDDLAALYTSTAFEEEEGRNLDLLRALARDFPSHAVVDAEDGVAYVPLKDVWNVFDQLRVAGGVTGPSPELRALASWVEHQRFSRETAGPKLGANLWNEILQRADSVVGSSKAQAASPSSALTTPPADLKPPHKFVLYSAHYPTILSLLSAMDLFAHNPELLADGREIPEYAAALIVELWQSSEATDDAASRSDQDTVYIRLRYKHDLATDVSEAPFLSLGPACQVASQEHGVPQPSCPLDVLKASAADIPGWPADIAEWCAECRNTRSAACMDVIISQMGNETCESVGKTSSLGDPGPLYFLLSLLGLMVAAATGMVVGCWWQRLRTRKRALEPDAQGLRDVSLEMSAPLETKA